MRPGVARRRQGGTTGRLAYQSGISFAFAMHVVLQIQIFTASTINLLSFRVRREPLWLNHAP